MNATLVDAAQLKHSLSGDDAPLVLDVRLEDDFKNAHLPQAKNNCVFEVVFLERMTSLVPDKNTLLCVYGAGAESLESRIAVEKLERAGYQNVQEFRDGLQAWKTAGFPLEGKAPSDSASPFTVADGVHNLDLAESRVEWTGRNLLNKHQGKLGIKDGSLRFHQGQLVGGEIVFDMHDITCYNLAGDALHDVLVNHLRSDDFFDVALYPTATFTIQSAVPCGQETPGSPNLKVRGELALKNVTLPIDLIASAGFTPEGKPAAQAAFAFDRTQWNVLYGSGRFFQRLAGHLVNDLIEVQVRMIVK